MNQVTVLKEHDYEPLKGLPAPLPAGESILWQGAPDWRSFAVRAMHVRPVAIYFAILIAWGIIGGVADGTSAHDIAASSVRLMVLGSVAIGLLAGYAWMVARTTVYTVTTKRVVLRAGIAMPLTIQIAYKMIDGAGLRLYPNGAGDITLTLRPGQKIAYLLLWPHARPWKYSRTEPLLRGVPDAASVAQILSRALAASAEQAATPVAVSASSRRGSAHVPAAA